MSQYSYSIDGMLCARSRVINPDFAFGNVGIGRRGVFKIFLEVIAVLSEIMPETCKMGPISCIERSGKLPSQPRNIGKMVQEWLPFGFWSTIKSMSIMLNH